MPRQGASKKPNSPHAMRTHRDVQREPFGPEMQVVSIEIGQRDVQPAAIPPAPLAHCSLPGTILQHAQAPGDIGLGRVVGPRRAKQSPRTGGPLEGLGITPFSSIRSAASLASSGYLVDVEIKRQFALLAGSQRDASLPCSDAHRSR